MEISEKIIKMFKGREVVAKSGKKFEEIGYAFNQQDDDKSSPNVTISLT